jgi:hypothetical protein
VQAGQGAAECTMVHAGGAAPLSRQLAPRVSAWVHKTLLRSRDVLYCWKSTVHRRYLLSYNGGRWLCNRSQVAAMGNQSGPLSTHSNWECRAFCQPPPYRAEAAAPELSARIGRSGVTGVSCRNYPCGLPGALRPHRPCGRPYGPAPRAIATIAALTYGG